MVSAPNKDPASSFLPELRKIGIREEVPVTDGKEIVELRRGLQQVHDFLPELHHVSHTAACHELNLPSRFRHQRLQYRFVRRFGPFEKDNLLAKRDNPSIACHQTKRLEPWLAVVRP